MREANGSISRDSEIAPSGDVLDGDVDVSLIEYNLSLTIAERIRQHDRALAMVNAFRRAGAKAHGITASGSVETPGQ
jgi:hypothetical protein